MLVLLPEVQDQVRLTLEARRRELRRFGRTPMALVLAWSIAGTLAAASLPAARPRQRQGTISLRLDRLGSQLQFPRERVVATSVQFDALLFALALEQGLSPDPDLQRNALNYFASDLLRRADYPPLRVILGARDLPRLRDGISTHPFMVVLQIFLLGTSPMIKEAGKRARGRTAQTAEVAEITRLLACLAEEVMSRDQELFRQIQVRAHQEGYGTHPMSVTKLEAIYFLVSQAMKEMWGYDLEKAQEHVRDFARTYLYPYREQLSPLVARCLEVPGLWARLLGLRNCQ